MSMKILLVMVTVGFITVGCAKDDMHRLNREQAITIQSLNQEIARLNQELDELMRAREELVRAKSELESSLKDELASGNLSVTMDERGLVLSVLDRVLFDSGKSDLKGGSEETLNKVADILKGSVGEQQIYIEGHTDNVPIQRSGWKSNWELSTARATEVIHFFTREAELNPERFVAKGYGPYRPISQNDDKVGRSKNRRVEIVISPKKMSGTAPVAPVVATPVVAA